MTWLATGLTVGSSAYSIYSGMESGKAKGKFMEEQGRQSMLTAYRRIANRNKTSYLATEDVKERGGDAVINQYMASNKDIANTKAEASGSGAVISGTVKDVMRSKEKQLDAVVTSINDNTQRNIEGITRDTIAQNKEDLITAQTTQNFMNQQANDQYKANQRKLVSGIISTAASGYSVASARSSSGQDNTPFWNQKFASWDQIQSGDFHI